MPVPANAHFAGQEKNARFFWISCTNIFLYLCLKARNEKENRFVTQLKPSAYAKAKDLGLFGFWFKGCESTQNEKGTARCPFALYLISF